MGCQKELRGGEESSKLKNGTKEGGWGFGGLGFFLSLVSLGAGRGG